MKAPLRALLAERIDYAGLFPPAALPMEQAVANYASYRASGDAWALGRFVVPVARLAEFEAAALPNLAGSTWRVAVLAQPSDVAALTACNARLDGRVLIDVVETRALSVADVESCAALSAVGTVFVEIPVRDDPSPLIGAIATQGLCAKIRTGGITPDAFPSPAEVARFLVACARTGARFKATAGLHHPWRGEYPLTYDANAVRGTMYGYLNIFLAAVLARRGADEATCAAVLAERDLSVVRMDDRTLRWRTQELSVDELRTDREHAVSFGSCSFREPLDDLQSLSFA